MDKFELVDRNGVVVNPGEDYDFPYDWTELGSLSSATTTPGVGTRKRSDISSLVSNSLALELNPPNASFTSAYNSAPTEPNGAISYEIRFRSNGAEDDTFVTDILAAGGPLNTEHYSRKATLTSLQGTQQTNTGGQYFHDSIAESNGAWFDETDRCIPITARENYIASYIFNVNGLLSFVFVPTTIGYGATLYIDYRRFS